MLRIVVSVIFVIMLILIVTLIPGGALITIPALFLLSFLGIIAAVFWFRRSQK